MPIEVKEVIVRAWVGSQNMQQSSELKKVTKTGNETTELQAELIEQLKRMITNKKDR